MNTSWYSGALRWIASGIARLADRLDAQSHYAPPLEPNRETMPAEERVLELRNRLSRYY